MKANPHIEQMAGSYIRNILKSATRPEVISLAGGLPDINLLPTQVLQEIACQQLTNNSLFQYGESAGYLPLREWIANDENSHPEQIIITNGAQQGLDLVTRGLLNPNDSIIVEAPGYLGAIQIFNLQNLNIIWIPQLTNSSDLELQEEAFKLAKAFYCVPDFHNPTGYQWPLALRQAVVAMAVKHNTIVLEDAPYKDLRFTEHEIPSLLQLAPQQVIKLGSFSKSIAPGLRTGYFNAPKDTAKLLLKVKQAMDLHSSYTNQAIAHAFIQSSYYLPHLKRIREAYSKRMNTLYTALNRLPNVEVDKVNGGMFMWAKVAGIDTAKLAEECLEKHNLAIVPGQAFKPEDECAADNYLRLNFTHCSCQQLEEASRRLHQATE